MPIKRLSASAWPRSCWAVARPSPRWATMPPRPSAWRTSAPKAYTSSPVSEAQPHRRRGGRRAAGGQGQGAAALASGGSAVDAVATMFFTLTATYPVAAGLGAGGICLVRDASGQVHGIRFSHPRAGARRRCMRCRARCAASPTCKSSMARCPGSAWWRRAKPMPPPAFRCRRRWRSGWRMPPRSIVQPISCCARIHRRHQGAECRRRNPQPDPGPGAVASSGLQGADGFYKGQLAAPIDRRLASQGPAARWTRPNWRRRKRTIAARPRRGRRHLAAQRPHRRRRLRRLADGQSFALRARSRLRAGGAARRWPASASAALPRDLGSTGFAAVDANGQAASCAVTMNGPFGDSAGNTGVQLGPSPWARRAWPAPS